MVQPGVEVAPETPLSRIKTRRTYPHEESSAVPSKLKLAHMTEVSSTTTK